MENVAKQHGLDWSSMVQAPGSSPFLRSSSGGVVASSTSVSAGGIIPKVWRLACDIIL